MSETCEILAEVVITTAKSLPGGATAALEYANSVMCFYAPQTCAALPLTLAAGGAIDAWVKMIEHSQAFEELNKMAFEKGCRLVISPIGESKETWRVMVVAVEDIAQASRVVAEKVKSEIKNANKNARSWLGFFNTPDGIMWLMNRLSGM